MTTPNCSKAMVKFPRVLNSMCWNLTAIFPFALFISPINLLINEMESSHNKTFKRENREDANYRRTSRKRSNSIFKMKVELRLIREQFEYQRMIISKILVFNIFAWFIIMLSVKDFDLKGNDKTTV